MSAEVIIQKYSQSLFEVGESLNKTEALESELSQLVPAFSLPEVLAFFESPFNSADNKCMVAKSALEGKCSPEIFNFIITLVQNERIGFVAQISESLKALIRAKGGETEGVLYSPTEVGISFKSQVETKLSQALNKKVKLSVQKDESLLSGYKVSVGGWTLDDSAQFHLNKIKDEISKRGI
jgi:ATP synthase F1 delta subunit